MYRHLQKCLYKGLCPKLSTNERKGLALCDYVFYASYVECYFTKPYVIPFDECGLPIQVSTKIEKYISNESMYRFSNSFFKETEC